MAEAENENIDPSNITYGLGFAPLVAESTSFSIYREGACVLPLISSARSASFPEFLLMTLLISRTLTECVPLQLQSFEALSFLSSSCYYPLFASATLS